LDQATPGIRARPAQRHTYAVFGAQEKGLISAAKARDDAFDVAHRRRWPPPSTSSGRCLAAGSDRLAQLPKALHPISKRRDRKRHRHPASRNMCWRRLHPPRRTMTKRARQSPLFPVMAKPSDVRRASVPQATGLPPANRKTPFNGPSDSHFAACRQRVYAAFRAAICVGIGMTKLCRGVNECAGLEAVGYRPHYCPRNLGSRRSMRQWLRGGGCPPR
jgi:hypothetical protein